MVEKKLLKKERGNMDLEQVEPEDLEFKSNWRDEYLKVICAFANADGGKLVTGVEMGEHFYTVVLPRMKKVLTGEKSGNSKEVNWQGGGFFK